MSHYPVLPVLRWIRLVGVLSGLLLLPTLAFGLVCADLDTPEKMQGFLKKAKAANPLSNATLSVYLEVSPCERQTCAPEYRQLRIALLQNLHVLRAQESRRVVVLQGPDAGQCLISRGLRDYICAQCDLTNNRECRSIPRQTESTRLAGTNIELSDFDLVTNGDYETQCDALPQFPGFLKLTSNRGAASDIDGTYEQIVTFVDSEREVPVTINLIAQGVLRKVYRFFPKFYAQIDGQWVATIIRVRSTQGREDSYAFETQVRILPDAANKPRIYPDPATDPNLRGVPADSLFFTN